MTSSTLFVSKRNSQCEVPLQTWRSGTRGSVRSDERAHRGQLESCERGCQATGGVSSAQEWRLEGEWCLWQAQGCRRGQPGGVEGARRSRWEGRQDSRSQGCCSRVVKIHCEQRVEVKRFNSPFTQLGRRWPSCSGWRGPTWHVRQPLQRCGL